MRHLWLVLLVFTAACALEASARDGAVAFVHVNVVPMDREHVLRDHTVIVADGRVLAMGLDLAPPEGARVIDGHGTAYLSPGLADMHTHSESAEDLSLYLANGVTSVLHMGGARPGFVANLVPAVNRGAIPGPHVYTSFKVDGSGRFNGFVIKTPAEARAIVGLARTNGYDFMKVYVGLSSDVYAALADEGRRLGMPLVGHGVYAVRLERQLAAGQVLVAHAEEFFYSFFTPEGVDESDTPPDPARIAAAVQLAKAHDSAVTADIGTYAAIERLIGRPDRIAESLQHAEAHLVSPADRLAWTMSGYAGKSADLAPKLAFLRRLVKAMADADVELLAGTDAPTIPGLVPGFSLHDSLAQLEQSGLSRFAALTSATRAPGAFMSRTKGVPAFGVVAPGYRADLILSESNPLVSLDTLRRPLGVMVSGRWRDAGDLDALIAGVRERYRRDCNTGRRIPMADRECPL